MANSSDTRSGINAPLIIVLILALTSLGLWWYWSSQPRQATPPPALTAEAKAYTRNLQLSGVEMKATANYAGAMVVEIVGKITNNGDRQINRVELTCIFYDPYGQVVLRERLPIVRTLIKPGDTKEFRLPFEGIPGSWNQAMPQMVIAHIAFAG